MNNTVVRTIAAVLLLCIAGMAQQARMPRNVAIFVYEGVEILDFAGPGEVFAAARLDGWQPFNVYTVAATADPITSQGFVKITPEFTIANCPKPDVIVLPGGNTSVPLRNEAVIQWIRDSAQHLDVALSVCTGAALLAKAGLLDGKHATTWWGYVDRFQATYPEVKVHRDKRFVDNGQMVTTAGVSAGIDGALHVVSRLHGEDVARETARYMEYDKWEPSAGLVFESKSLGSLRNNADSQALDLSKREAPYEGEMRNLGQELRSQGRLQEAVSVLQFALSLHPQAHRLHRDLAELYEQLGKTEEAKAQYREVLVYNQASLEVADKVGFEATMALFNELASNQQLQENATNALGYQFLNADRVAEAVGIFELNVRAFPGSWNAYDSLAEGYLKQGNKEQAVEYYRKSLALNPENSNAAEALSKLASN